MTECTKPVTRKTLAGYRGRNLVITLHPTWLAIRQAGRRTGYVIDYAAVFEAAGKLAAREAKAEKLAAKKSRRDFITGKRSGR